MDIQILPTTISTVSAANQTALPSLVLKSLNIVGGDRLIWEIDNKLGQVNVKAAPKDLVAYLRGSGKGVYGNADKYVNKLRSEWNRVRNLQFFWIPVALSI